MQLRGKIAFVTAAFLGAITLFALLATTQNPYSPKKINGNWTGYKDFKEMAESANLTIAGRVLSVYSSPGPNSDFSWTIFEVSIQRISKFPPDGGTPTVMVWQYGAEDGQTIVESKDDPLMKLGEEYVLLLVDETSNGTIEAYTTFGPKGRFKIISGMIYPISPSWSAL